MQVMRTWDSPLGISGLIHWNTISLEGDPTTPAFLPCLVHYTLPIYFLLTKINVAIGSCSTHS